MSIFAGVSWPRVLGTAVLFLTSFVVVAVLPEIPINGQPLTGAPLVVGGLSIVLFVNLLVKLAERRASRGSDPP